MPVDRLISTNHHLVRFLRQSASYARSCELISFSESLARSANALEAAVREFLSAPPDESYPREASWLDSAVEQLSDPRAMPTRAQVLWTLDQLRHARRIVRRYLAAAEIAEPQAERIIEAQRWIDGVNEGPRRP